NILLNLMLIPRFSYMGAVFATNLTRFFVISIEAVLLYRIGFLPGAINYWKIWIKIISSTAVMGIFIVLFKEINLFILMPFAALIYFSLLYLMKGLNIARTVKDQNG
ncbi:MAG: polysaccharide biosynthesis C-terminal domain-containing protein, partial [Candidatus Omnitrophica bacterium]|nr:polysaccharide biosynthesis C-terminal domain-containing protein [Candidatus Omnitrophota bacterium]